jgi:hypothetical protein
MATRWLPPDGSGDPAMRLDACPRCGTPYEDVPGAHFLCEVCEAHVTVPDDPPPPT